MLYNLVRLLIIMSLNVLLFVMYNNPNQYMWKDKFQHNKTMVDSNLNIPSMWWISFLKPQLYANVTYCSLVCINLMYVCILVIDKFF
jgi:hypothetical protein